MKREEQKLADIARNFEWVISALGSDVNNLGSPTGYLSLRYFSLLPLVIATMPWPVRGLPTCTQR